MMSNNYYIVSLGGYLHDLGKIVTNYLCDCEDFRIYNEKSRGVKSHRHAKVGSLLLSDYMFSEFIIDLVEKHHENETGSSIEIIQLADRFDANYRSGTAKDKGKKLPIEIAAMAGLDVVKTLHGFDLGEYMKCFLKYVSNVIKDNPRLAALLVDGFYREATIHLRSDSEHDEHISLYAHSKIVAALTSLKIRYPYSKPALVIIEPAIEERAQFMTIDVVEYLAGLHLYTYFGVLGAISSALEDLKLEPSFHIVSEASSRFVVIIGEEHIEKLIDYLRKLAIDLEMSICVEFYTMERGMLRKNARSRIDPGFQAFLTSKLICDVCHQPIRDERLMLTLSGTSKTIRLCEHCSIVMHSYKLLSSNGGLFCIKRAVGGLLRYPQLGLTVIPCNLLKDNNYIIVRAISLQNRSIETETLVPSIDTYLNVFQKKYKYLASISFTKLLNKLISENRLHEYASTINILNKYVMHVINQKQNSDVYPLEIVDDRAVLEILTPIDMKTIISNLLGSKFKEHVVIALVHKGAPGTTYKKLRYVIREITKTNKIIVMETPGNALSLEDISVFSKLSRLLNVAPQLLYKRFIRLLEILDTYLNSLRYKDEVEKVYFKSIILSRIFEPMMAREETIIPELFLPLLEVGDYGLMTKEENIKEEISKFFNEESNVRQLINAITFINKLGEVIMYE